MELEILKLLIPYSNNRRPGKVFAKYNFEAKWITIHNTANPTSTAINERNWLVNPSNTRVASWHYCVDEKQIVQAIPEDEIAWHAGSFEGNNNSIGVEICDSGNRDQTYKNGVILTAHLLNKYKWDIDKIRTHQSWSGKNCPWWLLPIWSKFIKDVQKELNNMKIEKSIIKYSIHGKDQEIEGVFFDSVNYVPIRILERLGYKVDWESKEKKVLVDYKD